MSFSTDALAAAVLLLIYMSALDMQSLGQEAHGSADAAEKKDRIKPNMVGQVKMACVGKGACHRNRLYFSHLLNWPFDSIC